MLEKWKMNQIRKWFLWLFLVCLGVYLVLNVKLFVVTSNSMNPEINSGDLIITTKMKQENLEIGNIVTYAPSNSEYLTHRIIEQSVNKSEIITKGDANKDADTPYKMDKKIYKFMIKISKIGKIFMIMKSVWIWVAILFILIIVRVCSLLIKEIKKKG